MKLNLKIQRSKPEIIILNFLDRAPITMDYQRTSTVEIMKIIRSTPWTDLEAYIGGAMIWKVERDEVDDLVDDEEEDDDPIRLPAMPTIPDFNPQHVEPFVAPERWLSLMIHAQQSASMGERETIKLLLSTMQENNDRSQDLLTQAHNMIVSQQEQIETLVDRVHADPPEKEEADWEGRIERIVEGLAPIVAPLLMRATQSHQAQPVAQPVQPQQIQPPQPSKKGKKEK